MRRDEFHYELPAELIAQSPLSERSDSRLLVVDPARGTLADRRFASLPELLDPTDLLVLNDTRVLPARLFGIKASGGRIEVLLERVLSPRRALVQIRASRAPRVGAELGLPGKATARVCGRHADLFELELDRPVQAYFERCGSLPLPPYIERPPVPEDSERYQTVYAQKPGAVAAPTAGLHFDADLLAQLRARGIEQAFLTLHVGLGTFGPVRTETIEEHVLHHERIEVSAAVCQSIAAARRRGGRVVAVGTTVVRALEAAALPDGLKPTQGETNLFIYPGFGFRVVDALITNLHLPESSLLMLVAAFAGRQTTLRAYRHAVEQRYRFFSYGDAMFVARRADPETAHAI
jgi:S-adenosylmethionine:tRNA ribosyltransferase-isomerase